MWTELHAGLRDHPKTVRLARDLGVQRAHAVGHLVMLWCWTMDHAVDGDLGSFEPEDIETAAGWEGAPGTFVAALEARRWLERGPHGLVVHDWFDYAGSFKAAERQRNKRAKDRAEKAAQRDSDATVTQPSRDSHATVTPSRARADRTGPDQNRPDQAAQDLRDPAPPFLNDDEELFPAEPPTDLRLADLEPERLYEPPEIEPLIRNELAGPMFTTPGVATKLAQARSAGHTTGRDLAFAVERCRAEGKHGPHVGGYFAGVLLNGGAPRGSTKAQQQDEQRKAEDEKLMAAIRREQERAARERLAEEGA